MNISKALQYGSQINFAAALKAFETADLGGEVTTIEDLMRIIGVFVPPVAIAANDLAAAVDGYEILLSLASLGPGTLSDNAGEQQSKIAADRFGH